MKLAYFAAGGLAVWLFAKSAQARQAQAATRPAYGGNIYPTTDNGPDYFAVWRGLGYGAQGAQNAQQGYTGLLSSGSVGWDGSQNPPGAISLN